MFFRKNKPKRKAFFSYVRKHRDIVRDFYNFSSIFEADNFLDEQSIPLGADFPDAIRQAVESCDVFILMWCACANSSEWVGRELMLALENDKPIFPVLLGDAKLPQAIENVNGLKLHARVCVQTALGASADERLFADRYKSLSAGSKQQLLKQISERLDDSNLFNSGS